MIIGSVVTITTITMPVLPLIGINNDNNNNNNWQNGKINLEKKYLKKYKFFFSILLVWPAIGNRYTNTQFYYIDNNNDINHNNKIMIIYIIYDKNDITDYKINMFVHIEIKNIFAGTDTVGVHASYGIWMFCIFATFPGIYAIIAAALADYFGQKHYQAQPFSYNALCIYFLFFYTNLKYHLKITKMFFLSLKTHHKFCYVHF